MPSSLAVSPLLMPAARKYAASDADADVARAREAEAAADRGAVDRADDRLVHLADRDDDVVEQLERAPRDRRDREAVDVRDDARVLEVGARAEPVARAGEHDDAHVVVVAQRLERLAQRDHHVERHRVHALGPVQRDERDIGPRLVDQDELMRTSRS